MTGFGETEREATGDGVEWKLGLPPPRARLASSQELGPRGPGIVAILGKIRSNEDRNRPSHEHELLCLMM